MLRQGDAGLRACEMKDGKGWQEKAPGEKANPKTLPGSPGPPPEVCLASHPPHFARQ